MTEIQIRKATSADFNPVASLLQSASLPLDGVAEHFETFLVAESGEEIVGAIGLELYGQTALLRSAVVHPSLRNKGIGSRLYDALLEVARSNNVRRLILLTETAEKYFAAKGFQKINAKDVRGPITRSAEFTGACSATAVCMELLLAPQQSAKGASNGEIPGVPENLKRVLILCTGNSARSQMSEGWLRHFGSGKLEVFSAGTRPCFVHPLAIQAMSEAGIDITSHRSKSVNEFVDEEFDYVITVCDNAREECPYLPGAHVMIHKPFEDPSFAEGTPDERLDAFRRVRDVIRDEMKEFANAMTS
jgi:thioredoxin type arsenate reductase